MLNCGCSRFWITRRRSPAVCGRPMVRIIDVGCVLSHRGSYPVVLHHHTGSMAVESYLASRPGSCPVVYHPPMVKMIAGCCLASHQGRSPVVLLDPTGKVHSPHHPPNSERSSPMSSPGELWVDDRSSPDQGGRSAALVDAEGLFV